jgi:membrane complex biogenesis BtpA family protein
MKLPKLIGIVRLPALAGSPQTQGQHPVDSLQEAGLRAVREAQGFVQAGYDGVLLENFGDVPYYGNSVPPETVASLSIIAGAVREAVSVPIGIHVLRNDARSALAIAAVTGCDFIRVNVFSGVTATEQGLIQGDSAYLLRERERLGASVAILADVHVQYGVTLSSFDIGHAIEELATRTLADGAIITGRTLGRLPDRLALEAASQCARALQFPFYLGSGVTHENLPGLKPWVDGFFVGSAVRKGSMPIADLDLKRTKELAKLFSQKGKLRKR